MEWFCTHCNYAENPDESTVCVACGSVRCARFAVLFSPATGRQIVMSKDTVIGRRLLKGLVGKDYQYAGDEQFRILRSAPGIAGWCVQHCEPNKNPTSLDGTPLGTSPQLLTDGAKLTIGAASALLHVTLADTP